jgi:hypothetical protein
VNHIVLTALVDLIAFLALSGEETVHEDAALAQLESTGALLKCLSPDEREQFLAFVRGAAEREENQERAEFLRSLPFSLGVG